MQASYRLYDRKLAKEIFPEYFEVPYIEYRDGIAVGAGTEDFSQSRLTTIKRIEYEAVWRTGRKNKGGHDTWDTLSTIVGYGIGEAPRTALRQAIKARYSDNKQVSIRKIF